MIPGDLLIHDYDADLGFGIMLNVEIDPSLLKNPWAVPWRYTVFWGDGQIREHPSGVVRRVRMYNSYEKAPGR